MKEKTLYIYIYDGISFNHSVVFGVEIYDNPDYYGSWLYIDTRIDRRLKIVRDGKPTRLVEIGQPILLYSDGTYFNDLEYLPIYS